MVPGEPAPTGTRYHIGKVGWRGAALAQHTGEVTCEGMRGRHRQEEQHVFGGMSGTEGVDAAKAIGAAIAIGVGGLGPAIGIGIAVKGAMDAIGRNPEAAGEVRSTMIVGAALAEAVAIYAFVIAIIIAIVL